MNEQIKRFSEQAINYATSKRPLPDLKDKDLFLNNLFEKFADLIVLECINATGNCAGTGDMIKEHFGIDVPPVSLRPMTIEETILATDN